MKLNIVSCQLNNDNPVGFLTDREKNDNFIVSAKKTILQTDNVREFLFYFIT
jgi:hypothetical protein